MAVAAGGPACDRSVNWWRDLRRGAASRACIGRLKSDGHLGRNFLLGTESDGIKVILAAAGHNLCLLRACLA